MRVRIVQELPNGSELIRLSRRSRFGFTLIEVLLTTVLAATLLAALWSLLSMYAKMFETGHARTEQSQLARALMRQISDDLHSVILTPPKVERVPVIASASPSAPAPATGKATDNGKSPSSPDRGERGRRFPVTKGPSLSGAQGNVGTASSNPGNNNSASNASANPVGSGLERIRRGMNRQTAATPTGKASPPNNSQPGNQQPAATPANDSKTVQTTSSLRPAGLFGTDTYLQIEIYQPTDPPPESDFGEPTGLGAIAPTRAPELRTIIYSFEETGEPGQQAGETQRCLTRRELDWEQAHPAGKGSQSGERAEVRTAQELATPFGASPDQSLGIPGAAPGLPGAAAGPQRSAPLQADRLLGDRLPGDQEIEGQTSDEIPEVMHFGLRYFDGAMWADAWDSVARQGLPVAIEVRLELKHPHDTLATAQAAAAATPTTPGVPPNDLTLTKRRLPSYRLVVHLPPATEMKPMASDRYAPGRNLPGESPRMDGGASPLRGDSHAGLR